MKWYFFLLRDSGGKAREPKIKLGRGRCHVEMLVTKFQRKDVERTKKIPTLLEAIECIISVIKPIDSGSDPNFFVDEVTRLHGNESH